MRPTQRDRGTTKDLQILRNYALTTNNYFREILTTIICPRISIINICVVMSDHLIILTVISFSIYYFSERFSLNSATRSLIVANFHETLKM